MDAVPTIFERKMLRRIGRWRTRKVGVLEQAMAAANRRIREAGGIVRRIPGFEWTVDNVAVGLLRTTNEFAQESVWQEAILEEYCRAGHEVCGVEDVRALDLEIVHTAVRGLTVKYGSVTAAHGAAAGLAGFAGIVPDVIGLVAFNLRAAGEFATYCGYNIRESPERLFAVQILYHVSDPAPRSLEPALVSAETISRDIASRHAEQTIRQFAVTGSMRGISRALGLRLAKAKLAQVLPAVGLLVGGGFNALFTKRVCEAAYFLYLERRLLEKYPLDALVPYYGLES